MIVLAVALGGCPSDPTCIRNSDCAAGQFCSGGACTTECTPETVEVACGAGFSCSSFGMCIAPPDAPVADTGPRDAGGDAPPFDAPPTAACALAGGTDADGDGYCVDATTEPDCNDGDPTIHPNATEVCTPSTVDSSSVDENCDGALDEVCTWHFGAPHLVPQVLSGYVPGARVNPNGPLVASGGTHLYVTFSPATAGGSNYLLLSRASRSTAFAAPTAVAFVTGFAPTEFALSQDELTGVCGAAPMGSPDRDLYLLSRTSLSAPFSVTPIDAFSTPARENHPTLSRDGLELFFLLDTVLNRATRASLADAFTSATPVVGMPSPMNYPQLTDDDRTIVFAYAPPGRSTSLWRADRTSSDATTFGTPVELVELNPGGVQELNHPHVSLSTREIFFSSTSLATGGMARNLFRAELCLDGPCPPRLIDCPSPGIRSRDGLHCYFTAAGPGVWGNGGGACLVTGGAHLATLQSSEERAELWTAFGRLGNFWLGANDRAVEGMWQWDDGEPWIWAGWGTIGTVVQPDNSMMNENCGHLNSGTSVPGLLNDNNCDVAYAYMCETEMWPTW